MLKAITHYDQIPISAVVEIMEREMRKKEKEVASDSAEMFAADAPAPKGGGQ